MFWFPGDPERLQTFTVGGEGSSAPKVSASAASVPETVVYEWPMPRGTACLWMLAVGSGGGGAGGFQSGAGAARGGGGAGGGASLSWRIMPADALPRVLYLVVPYGGTGGTARRSGYTGGAAKIVTDPSSSAAAATVLASGSAGGLGGGTGSATLGGTAGSGASAPLSSQATLGLLGLWGGVPGGTGGNGGATGAGIAAGLFGSGGQWCCGGGGGGGLTSGNGTSAGGGITGAGPFPSTSGGVAAANGPDGHMFTGAWQLPLVNYGGTGGGSANTAFAGRGGNGAYGCGGGGGGAGLQIAPTGQVSTSDFSLTAHGLTLNTPITFSAVGTVTGLTTTAVPPGTGLEYYVVNVQTNTFQVSLTPNGTAVTLGGTNAAVTAHTGGDGGRGGAGLILIGAM